MDVFDYGAADFLAGHLEDMKWCDINCFAFDRVFAEILLKDMKKFILMIRILHIDEINQDDSGKISKPYLTGNLSSSFKIYFAVSLFCFFPAGVFSTVDINGNKCLRLLDNKKTSTFQPDFFMAYFIDRTLQTVKFI